MLITIHQGISQEYEGLEEGVGERLDEDLCNTMSISFLLLQRSLPKAITYVCEKLINWALEKASSTGE